MKYALYILIIFISFTFSNAQPNVFIKNVPDYSQPPTSTLPSSTDISNYCAPYAFLNIVEYWDSVQTQPFARGLMGGLSGKEVAEYIGWFMDTNNQGSPARENDNGRPAAPGTYVMDQWHGAEEFISFDASQTFLFSYTVPPQKNRYTWDIQFVPVANFLIFKDEIDLGNPVKLDLKYWTILPTGGFIYEPELAEDTILVYDWGVMVNQSGTTDERDPLETWNLAEGDAGIGHAVTAVGYLENYAPPDTNYVIVHDNWANTPKNIAIPWIDANITGWFFYHLSEPPDLAVTNIQTANDTSLGFTNNLQIHKPVTVAVTLHNQGSGGAGAGQYMCTTSVLDPLGSPVITNRKHPQTALYPQGAGQDSIIVYFDSLFTPTMTGGYNITSVVYWDMNGDSLENDSPEPNRANDTLSILKQVYLQSRLKTSDNIVPKFELLQNYPNPFNPKTVIRYALPVTGHIDLSIYNLLGQKVAKLINKKQPAGSYKIEWNASGFESGIYLYRLQTDHGFSSTKKLILLR